MSKTSAVTQTGSVFFKLFCSYLPALVVVGEEAEAREASAGERLPGVRMLQALVDEDKN